jgi:hypothetical protein
MAGKLREFIYLDEMSIDNHLSSLGEGIPEGMMRESGDEKTTTGSLSAKIPYMNTGGSAERSYSDSNNLQTKIALSAPYRFQTLKEKIADEGIQIYTDDDDLNSLSRADVVEISGSATTMSLFRLEVAIKAILNLMEGTQDSINSIEDTPNNEMSMEEVEEIGMLNELVEKFTGDRIPLRMNADNYTIGIALNRSNMRMNPERTFIESEKCTLFGRVEQILSEDQSWDPVDATNVLDRYLPGEPVGEEFRNEIEVAAEQLNIPMNQNDMLITGPGAIVHPVALYW